MKMTKVIAVCASHINTMNRLLNLTSILKNYVHLIPIYIGISYDINFENNVTEMVNDYPEVHFLIQKMRKSQMEHYYEIMNLLISYSDSESELKKENEEERWLIFFDDDDIWTIERIYVFNSVIGTLNKSDIKYDTLFLKGPVLCKIEYQDNCSYDLSELLSKCVYKIPEVSMEHVNFSARLDVFRNFLESLKETHLLIYRGSDLILKNYLACQNCYIYEYQGYPLYYYIHNKDMIHESQGCLLHSEYLKGNGCWVDQFKIFRDKYDLKLNKNFWTLDFL